MSVEALAIALVYFMLLFSLVVYIVARYRKRLVEDHRASALLCAILSPDQYRQLIRAGHIDIKSPSDPDRVYRVPKSPGRVQVREKGKLTMWLCLQPSERIPAADIVVIHKLMIEADEETYLRKANHIRSIYPGF